MNDGDWHDPRLRAFGMMLCGEASSELTRGNTGERRTVDESYLVLFHGKRPTRFHFA